MKTLHCLVSFPSFILRHFVIAPISHTIQTTLQLNNGPSPRLHPLWKFPWIFIISLCTDVPPPLGKIGRGDVVSSPDFSWRRGDVWTQAILSSVILLPTGKARKIAIGVSVGAVVLIALVISVVCFVRRRKARALSYQLTTANARNALMHWICYHNCN